METIKSQTSYTGGSMFCDGLQRLLNAARYGHSIALLDGYEGSGIYKLVKIAELPEDCKDTETNYNEIS